MKKILIGIVLVIGVVAFGLYVYRLISPEILIENASRMAISEVIVQLPSNRVVFGGIQPGAESRIYYSSLQSDGVYNYSVTFQGGPVLTGSCGYVTNSDVGKRMQLLVHDLESAVCNESNKIP